MRLPLIILVVLSFSAVFAYDLELTVNASPVFNLSQSNSYSIVVKNLNGTAPSYINFTVGYWINSSSGFVSGYPMSYAGSLEFKNTTSIRWNPSLAGDFTICGNITNSTTNDTNFANDFACKNVLVNGSLPAEDVMLSIHIDSPAVMGVDYTSLFQIEIKNKAAGGEQESVTVNYNITKDGALVKDSSFTREVNCSGYANTGEWIPQADGNYTICGVIESTTSGDENLSNNAVCGIIEVIDPSTIACDLSIAINNTKLIYLSSESIDYDLITNDVACSNLTHPYIVQYWIEDLFGNYLRTPYNSSDTIECADAKNRTKQAPSLCGSEVYFIRAAIVQPFCNDTNADNDAAEQMIIVKGSNPNSITCKSSSSSTSSNSTSSAKESPNFAVKISSVPNQVHQGETIVAKFSLTNSYTTMKTFDIYSYAYSGQKIASEGGWTGNKMSLQIPANDVVDASIINTIRQDAEPGKYSFRVRAALGDDKADDTVDMEVLPGNGTSLSNKSGEITSFYTRTRNLVADDEIKLYANVKNLQNQNQTFELKLDNGTETIMLEKKASKTFNFSVRLPFEDLVDYKLLLMQNSTIIDEKNLTLQIGENTNSIEKANISKKEATDFTGIANVNWSSKSSSNVAAILFSFALLLLSLSLLATAISSKRA